MSSKPTTVEPHDPGFMCRRPYLAAEGVDVLLNGVVEPVLLVHGVRVVACATRTRMQLKKKEHERQNTRRALDAGVTANIRNSWCACGCALLAHRSWS